MNGEAFPVAGLWRLAGRGMRWLSWSYLVLGVAAVIDLVRAVSVTSGSGGVGQPIGVLVWVVAFLVPTRILARRWEGNAARHGKGRAS